MVTIKINSDAFRGKLLKYSDALTTRLMATMNELTKRLQARILTRPGTPVSADHRRKGWLANSVIPVPASASGGTISGSVQAAGGPAWYGKLFEEGSSSPYPIIAANKKALAFELAGQSVIVKSVMHPAFDSSRLAFMKPAFLEAEPEMIQMIRTTVAGVLHGE